MTDSDRSFSIQLLTPNTAGAVAVIRVAGGGALSAVSQCFQPRGAGGLEHVDEQQLLFGRFVDEDDEIDEGLVAARRGRSGGCVIDLCVHGGVKIVERLSETLQRLGGQCRLDDCCAGGDASLIEIEAIEALSRAKTRRVVRFLARQRKALPRALRSIARDSVDRRGDVRQRLDELLLTWESARRLVEGIHVAIVGPVNAGKSTLANALVGGSQSLVSAQPGTTRDWVDRESAIYGVPVMVVDTAGVRDARDELEREAISRGMKRAADADVQIIVLDASVAFPQEFWERWIPSASRARVMVAINKVDLQPVWSTFPNPADLVTVRTSGLNDIGIAELGEGIMRVLSLDAAESDGPALFTRRQFDWISGLRSGDILKCSGEMILEGI